MCYNYDNEFTECGHKWSSHVECDEVKRSQKCRKARRQIVAIHQLCPRCDPPGYAARTNIDVPGLQLSRSVQELQKEAARELARYQAYESKASAEIKDRLSREFDKKPKRESGSSLGSDDGGIKGKVRGILGGLGRMGSLAKKDKGKDSSFEVLSHRKQPSGGNERYNPISPLSQKPTIMRDENGYFHDPRTSGEAGTGRVVWDTSLDQNRERLRRSIGAALADGPQTSAPELRRAYTGKHVPEHSRSLESGRKDGRMRDEMWMDERGQTQSPEDSRSLELRREDGVLEEMWMKERGQMQSPEPLSPSNDTQRWPQRRESRNWDKVLKAERPTSGGAGMGHSRPVTSFPSSELSATQLGVVEKHANFETRPSLESRKPSTKLPRSEQLAWQTCPPEKERRRLIEAQAKAMLAADLEQARRERTRSPSQRAQGGEKRPRVHIDDSDDWDDCAPLPLRTLHHKKPSVGTIPEDPVIFQPGPLQDWEKCGIDYSEEDCDSSSIVTQSKLTHLNGMESGATGTSDKKAISFSNALMQGERPEGAKGIERTRPNVDPSGAESFASGESGDVRRDEKGDKRDPSTPSRKTAVVNEVVPDDEVRPESGGVVEKDIVRVRRGPTKGRGPLPKRKTSRERNAAEALQRADERLRSVRDGRGYIDFTFI